MSFNRVSLAMEAQRGDPYNTAVSLKTPKAMLLRSAVVLASEIPDAVIVAFTKKRLYPHKC